MLDIILVAALLVAPKDVDVNLIEVLRPTILTVSLNNEIIDPKECVYLLTSDYVSDFETLKNRNQEFTSYPRLDEYYIDRKLINNLIAINRSYRVNLIKRLEIDAFHEDVIKDTIIEVDQLYQVWDTLRDATCDYYNVPIRRQSLKLFRDLVGTEIFYSGQIPSIIPWK